MKPTKWMRWVIGLIGVVLVVAIAGIVLFIRAGSRSTTAFIADPTPTLSVFKVNASLSTACIECHTDDTMLAAASTSEEGLQDAYVDPESTHLLHGQLGCITCHEGTGDAADATAAHANLAVDRSTEINATCLTCHASTLTNEYPEDQLIAPHEQVASGAAQDVICSDCHATVGHGTEADMEPVTISMMACLDCHEVRQLEVQLEDCLACHTEMPAWTAEMDCSSCHTTESGATYAATIEDANLLGYAHAELGLTCLDCHQETDLEPIHNGTASGEAIDITTSEFCFSCHVENNHSNYDEVKELTEDTEEEYNADPHNSHNGKIDCSNCHMIHEESKDYCSSCHMFGWTVP